MTFDSRSSEKGCSAATYAHRLATVNRTAFYVEENLGEPISLDDICRAGGMSKFHLHRVFEENVGTTLGRFLSGARLKSALHLLSAPETRSMSVLEVALQVGFEDASAFSRSFHRRYALTPSSLRQGNRPREFPLVFPRTGRIGLDGLDRGVTVVSLPEFWIYGYEVEGMKNKSFVREAPHGFTLLWDTIRRHGIEGVRGDLGLSNYSWLRRDEACTLLCAFRSSDRLDLSCLKQRFIPAGKWLRARHTGPHATRWQTWNRLQIRQLRSGRPRDGRAPCEEEVVVQPSEPGCPTFDVFFPC
ncbi:MAG: AraC family transcriptional regulator [Polyangiaceae bacterium]